jgi:hypothetical protein
MRSSGSGSSGKEAATNGFRLGGMGLRARAENF